MGMPGPGSVSKLESPEARVAARAQAALNRGQPNPRDFEIQRHKIVNGYLILKIHYRGVENFEGEKILVFDRGITLQEIEKQDGIDPHFSDTDRAHHPIARFVPTTRGWFLAHRMAVSDIERDEDGNDAVVE